MNKCNFYLFVIVFLYSCTPREIPVIPIVTSGEVTNITTTTATCTGNVAADGGAALIARGVCWSTTENPTIANSKTTNGTGLGPYTSNITGLSPNTTYYVRAYATNSVGTAYGEQRTFTTNSEQTTPTVTTVDVTNITTTTADCSGNVTSDGNATITARGVCWSTSENPTTSNSKTTDGTGSGTYTSNITGLSPNTTYYVRAYATNAKGTAYGEDRFFTTLDPRQEATTLGGLITENTVLSINNSPYTITSDVQVAYNCTLTIEPGVIIYGNDKYITIWGVLNAIGSQDAKITFNNVNIAPGNNDQNELFLINVQHALINEGSLYKPTGYAIYGSINLKDSELTDIPYLYIWYPEANCNIERNIFNRCGGIMTVHNNNIKVYIRNNVFYQQADTSYSEFFAVANCASYDTSQTIVEFNSFLSTDKNALYLPTDYAGANIYAIKNFWNTTDLSVINTMIYDKNNDLGSANYIEFLPILTEPDTNTPVFNP